MSYQLSFVETYERMPTSGTPSGSLEKGVILRNSNFVRRFGDSGWNRIRVACRFRLIPSSSLVSDGVSIVPEQFFGMGFCHGTENVLGSQYIDNICGVRLKNAMTWTTTGYYSSTNFWWVYSGSADNVVTDEILASSGTGYRLYAFTSSLYGLMYDIQRDAVNPLVFTSSTFYPRTSTVPYYTDTDWLTDIILATPSRTEYTFTTRTNVIDETTYGKLNAVNVYWNLYEPCLEIVDLYVVRLA